MFYDHYQKEIVDFVEETIMNVLKFCFRHLSWLCLNPVVVNCKRQSIINRFNSNKSLLWWKVIIAQHSLFIHLNVFWTFVQNTLALDSLFLAVWKLDQEKQAFPRRFSLPIAIKSFRLHKLRVKPKILHNCNHKCNRL